MSYKSFKKPSKILTMSMLSFAVLFGSALIYSNAEAVNDGETAAMQGGMMKKGKMQRFKDMDSNGDGAVTLEELQAYATKMHKSRDTDGNGVINQEEFKTQHPHAQERQKRRQERFTQMDSDGDSTISKEEFQTFGTQRRQEKAAKRFAMVDRNKDNVISLEEMQDMQKQRFDRMDRNKDGKIDSSEMGGFRQKGRHGHGGKGAW